MTGCALEVSEGGLCLSSYPLKNPETILTVTNPCLKDTRKVIKYHLYSGKELKVKTLDCKS